MARACSWRLVLAAAAAFGAANCSRSADSGGGSVAPPPPVVSHPDHLVVTALTAWVDVGTTEPLGVIVIGTQHDTLTSYAPFWTSSDTSVVRITPTGVFTTLKYGAAELYVTEAGLTDSVAVAVSTPLPAGSRYTQVAVKAEHACAITDGGQTYCWGSNSGGWVAPGSATPRFMVPTAVAGTPVFASLVQGNAFTCGLTPAGSLYCWGTIPTQSDGSTAVRQIAAGMTFTQVAAGSSHICGLTTTGDLYCWGSNTNGQLGIGTQARGVYPDAAAPARVVGNYQFTSVTASQNGTCGLVTDGSAVCWGTALPGVASDARGLPEPVGTARFASLSSGTSGGTTCGTTARGSVDCWGATFVFPFGSQIPANGAPGRLLTTLAFDRISIGEDFVCGLVGHTAYCWGSESHGQLGSGVIDARGGIVAPYPVLLGMQFTQLSTDRQTACGVTVTGRVACWGANGDGQVGNGQLGDIAVPSWPPLPNQGPG